MNSFSERKLKYGHLNGGIYKIEFPNRVTPIYFEPLLKECYKRSKKAREVIFDFSNVVFFDSFELGLVTTWILELKNANINIKVSLPHNKESFNFLRSYGFGEFLIKILEKENITSDLGLELGEESENSYFFGKIQRPGFTPLTFAFDKEFEEYFSKKKFQNLEFDLYDFRYTNVLRDIIIHELVENIHKYAKDTNPYIIMAVFRSKSYIPRDGKNKANSAFVRLQYGPAWEKSFFKTLISPEYLDSPNFLELVIGDGGPGIPAILGKIKKCKVMNNAQILDYAFEFDSTSDPKGRIKPILSSLTNKEEYEKYAKFPPPTGLYQVKEILKRYGGFLSVRSGDALVYYDFLTNQDFGRPAKEALPKQSLVNFIGTHYKIYLPLNPPSYFTRKGWSISRRTQYLMQIKVEYILDKISLKKHFSEQKNLASQAETLTNKILIEMSDKISSIENKIKTTIKKGSVNRGILLMDFEDIGRTNLSRKILHYLIMQMMWRQKSTVALIGINVSDDILADMQNLSQEIKKSREEKRKVHSLIVYNEKCKFNFIETRDGEKSFIKKLRESPRSKTELSDQEKHLIETDAHIIELDYLSGKYYLVNPEKEIFAYLLEDLKGEIKNFILDKSNGVFNPDVKVLVPSHYYAEGFFELGKIRENEEILKKIRKWLSYQIILLNKPPIIITTNKNVEEIIDDSIREKIKKWIKVSDPLKSETIPYADLVTIDKKDVVWIFCSAIGTGESINKILEIIKNKNISKIVTIVDARETKISPDKYNYDTYSYNLESIVERPLKFYKKPPSWDLDSIRSVDTQTYSIIVKPLTYPEEPLWVKDKVEGDRQKTFKSEFIEKVSKLTNSFSIGHSIIGKMNKHLIYNFDVSEILEKFGTEIANCITGNLDKLIKVDNSLKISHILYYTPSHEAIMKNLAGRIANNFAENKPNCEYVSYDVISDIANQRRPLNFSGISSVVLIVDFMSSGATLKKLIDTISQSAPHSIIVYILINRAGIFNTIFLSNISRYKNTNIRIRYLVNLPIPVFESHVCPVCKYINKLEELRRKYINNPNFKNKICIEFLENEIKKLKNGEVINLFSNSSINAKEILRLRWLLEISKSRIGARKQLKREIQKDQKVALNLLSTLYAEILYFFDSQKEIFDTIFYPEFKQALKEKFKSFGKNIKILSENTGPIILVWHYIDSEDFYTHMGDILSVLSDKDINLFWNIITFALIAEHLTGDKDTDKLINTLRNIPCLKSVEQQFGLETIISYLQLKKQILIPPRLYHMYLDARRSDYELSKMRKEIEEGKINPDLVRMLEDTIRLYEDTSVKSVNYILENGHLIKDQKDAIKRLEIKIEQDTKGLKKTLNYNDIKVVASHDQFMQEIKKRSLSFLDDLIELRETIDKIYMCNVSKTIDSIIDSIKEEKKDIIKKFGIKIDAQYQGIDWFAFIRWEDMERVLREIFENFEHAFKGREKKDNKVKILITQTPQEPEFKIVRIQILDNGNPVKESFDHNGHRLIKSLVERYGGVFQPLQGINPEDESNSPEEGYIKKTTISLIKLDSPQEE